LYRIELSNPPRFAFDDERGLPDEQVALYEESGWTLTPVDGYLTEGDYTATYVANEQTIPYPVHITPAKRTLTDGMVADFTKSYTYSGISYSPVPTVSLNGLTFSPGTDFIYSWENNTNAGTAYVVITPTADGKLTGAAVEIPFTIEQAELTVYFPNNASAITYGQPLSASTLSGGSTERGTFAWANGEKILSAGENNETVIFTPSADTQRNYKDYAASATLSVTVIPAPSNPADPSLSAATIGDRVGDVTITPSSAGTWAWVDASAQITASTYNALAIFTPTDTNYSTAEELLTINAAPRPLTEASITLSPEEFPYNGQRQWPDVTVSYNGLTFMGGSDYTLTYSDDCTNAGTKTVTVTAVQGGRLTGEAQQQFKITPAAARTVSCETAIIYSATDPVTVDLTSLLQPFLLAGDTPTVTVPETELLNITTDGLKLSILPNNLSGPHGSVPIELSVEGLTNYVSVTVNLTVDITDKTPVRIDILDLTDKYYDGQPLVTPAVNAPYEGYDGGFVYQWLMQNDEDEYVPIPEAPKNAGAYRLRVSVDDNAYYAGSQVADVTIRPRPLTVTVYSEMIYAGEELPEFTFDCFGFVEGEDFLSEPTLICDADTLNAGEYEISVSAEVSGNYELQIFPGTLTVRKLATTSLEIFPSRDSLLGGGIVTLTVTGIPEGGTLTVTGPESVYLSGSEGVWTARLPNANGSYTFTAHYSGTVSQEAATAECTVRVSMLAPGAFNPPKPTELVTPPAPEPPAPDPMHTLTVRTQWGTVSVPSGGSAVIETELGTLTVFGTLDGRRLSLSFDLAGTPIAAVPGGVTVTVPHAEPSAGIVAAYLNDVTVTETAVDTENGTVTFPLIGAAELMLENRAIDFTDVEEDDWYADAVEFVSARGLMTGMTPAAFEPGTPLSRAMMATGLWRMAGEAIPADSTAIPDLTPELWYRTPALWAMERGIVTGFEDGTFRGDTAITREQAIVMLWRYAGESTADTAALIGFADAAAISGYARTAMAWAVERGILEGEGGMLTPQAALTRSQLAAILMRFLR